MKKAKGFTLIELMVVIVILGILAAVIAPRIPAFVDKAKEGRTKGNLATLRSSMNIYYSDNDGWYPVATDSAGVGGCLVPKFMKRIPDCETVRTGHSKQAAFTKVDGSIIDQGDWGYDNRSSVNSWGDLWVNCQHTDLSGNVWTGF